VGLLITKVFIGNYDYLIMDKMSKKKNNTKNGVPKKAKKPEVMVTIQEEDVKSIKNNFELDVKEEINEIVENELMVEESIIDEPLSDEDKTELKLAEAEVIVEIANEAEEMIAQSPVEEKGLVYDEDYVSDPVIKRTLVDISSKVIEKPKKKSVSQLTREEYKMYQRTGILPNL
jgi:hypothetical protein